MSTASSARTSAKYEAQSAAADAEKLAHDLAEQVRDVDSGSSAKVADEAKPQLGVSYSAVLRSIFGIESEFDVDTEDKLRQFHDARKRLLTGDESARGEVDRLRDELANRSDELREIIALERGSSGASARAAPSSRSCARRSRS